MEIGKFKRTKLACYTAYFTMSSIFSLPPLLFMIFHEMYGISYTLLGTLVLTNFFTQLTVDLIFTVFSKHFNIGKIVRVMPLITSAGLLIYALSPILFPGAVFVGLVIGTVIFSVSAGLSEVMLSPTIAAIPSDNPQRDMSFLHSLYAFGVFSVVVISTLFFKIFGGDKWMILTLFFAALPIIAAVLFMLSPMPEMSGSENTEGIEGTKRRTFGLALCVACIFFGSCAENVMSNWVSGYMENALHIDKAVGDILGMAMFAILLGIARITYARFGKKIMPSLFIGMVGAVVCYLTAGLSSNTVVALVACALTGMFTSMLWPGALIMMEENLPGVGVAAYALMASGGDLGASLAPQLMGIVVDSVSVSEFAVRLSESGGMTPDQIGMKVGMLVTAIFPLIGAFLIVFVHRYFKKLAKDS
ncbi:MAG: MFS transporter [Clostridia bacterium]|nr:MFS transporter [Clostridia bacterium]